MTKEARMTNDEGRNGRPRPVARHSSFVIRVSSFVINTVGPVRNARQRSTNLRMRAKMRMSRCVVSFGRGG
jgi:hypothetical protein